MNDNIANDNISLTDAHDWLAVLQPKSFAERAEEFNYQLENVANAVTDMDQTYHHFSRNYKEYRGQELFEGIGDRPEFLQAEYNYALVETCLVRAYTALRHIDVLNDISLYSSDFPEHNRNDAYLTLGSAVTLKNHVKKAFQEVHAGDEWRTDPDQELVSSMADTAISIDTLEDLVMNHLGYITGAYKRDDTAIIKHRAKSDLVDDLNLNIHLYSVYALAQMDDRIRYAKGLFNVMAKEPESLPDILREGYPHPDLYLNETLFLARQQLDQIPAIVGAALHNNDLSSGTVSRHVPPVISGQSRRGLPLFAFDLNA